MCFKQYEIISVIMDIVVHHSEESHCYVASISTTRTLTARITIVSSIIDKKIVIFQKRKPVCIFRPDTIVFFRDNEPGCKFVVCRGRRSDISPP